MTDNQDKSLNKGNEKPARNIKGSGNNENVKKLKKPNPSVHKKEISKKGEVQAKSGVKKIVRHRSKTEKFLRKFGIFLLVIFAFSSVYLFWLYAMPPILNKSLTPDKISEYISPKIGFYVQCETAKFTTDNNFNIGLKVNNLKVFYPVADKAQQTDEKHLFLKARSAEFELPFIPLLMKTIKFNTFNINTVSIELFQDEEGKYGYLSNIREQFNPQMPKYVLEIPQINLNAYSIKNFNLSDGSYKKENGEVIELNPIDIKGVLEDAKYSNSIKIR